MQSSVRVLREMRELLLIKKLVGWGIPSDPFSSGLDIFQPGPMGGEDTGQFVLAWLERRALGASIIDFEDFPFLQGLHIFTLYANSDTNRKMVYSRE